ncbi:WD repeat-containing protein 64 [Chlorella vulgaris]
MEAPNEHSGAGPPMAAPASARRAATGSAEVVICLENLVKMKRVFEEADEDGSGELDPQEFYDKLGPFLGPNLSPTQVAQLFMRIDADCGGTIDWEEFTNYFFLQRAATSTADGGTDWRLHAQDFWRREWRGCSHKEAVEKLYCCTSLDQYVTAGRSGQLRVWSAPDMAPLQVLNNGSGWITDCALLEGHAAKKLAVAAHDRTITFYDVMRSGYEYSGRLTCPGSLGPPLCLATLRRGGAGGGHAPPRLVWGDTEGCVMLLKCEPPLLPTPRPLVARKDFEALHCGHSDWVTQVQHIPEVGLVSSSLDATLCLLDVDRGKLAATVALHRKGVRCFGYSPAFSLVASGGIERSVLLWQPKGNVSRAVGELSGHSAGVQQLVVADDQSQVITLSDDHIVRVWDLRTHKRVQTLGSQDWLRPEDARPTAVCHDSQRRRLVCASHRPVVWSHQPVEVERLHDCRLVSALYNATFSVVVSGDEGGTICLWNLQNGRREGGFSVHSRTSAASSVAAAAGARGKAVASAATRAQSKLTALAFDAPQRRLLTASDCGEVKLWNFNSGAVLRQFLHREGRREVTMVAFVQQAVAGAAAPAATASAAGEGTAAPNVADDTNTAPTCEAAPAGGMGGAAGSDSGCGAWEEAHRPADLSTSCTGAGQQQQRVGGTATAAEAAIQTTDEAWLGGLGATYSAVDDPAPASAPDACNSNPAQQLGCEKQQQQQSKRQQAKSQQPQQHQQQQQQEHQLSHDQCGAVPPAPSQVARDNPLATDASAGESRGSSLVLATGWCRRLCVWEEGDEAQCSDYRRLEGHQADVLSLALLGADIAATGDFEGAVRVWHLPSGTCLACCSYGGAQFERAVRQLCWLPCAAGTAGPALLIAAGEEGGLHFWEVHLPAAVELPCRAATPEPFKGAASGSATAAAAGDWAGLATCRLVACVEGAHRPQDCVTALCIDASTQQLWVGDSEGHVAAWDLTPLRSAAGSGVVAGQKEDSDTAAAALPTQGVLWRASDSPIVSLDVMAAPSAAAAAGAQEEKGLLLVGAQDAAISIWTQQGGLVGVFGKHCWELDDRSTWQDGDAQAVPPPLAVTAGDSGLTPREIRARTPCLTSLSQAQTKALPAAAEACSRAATENSSSGGGSESNSRAKAKLPDAPMQLIPDAAGQLGPGDAVAPVAAEHCCSSDAGAAVDGCSSSRGIDSSRGSTVPVRDPCHDAQRSPQTAAVAVAAVPHAQPDHGPAMPAERETQAEVEMCLTPRSAGARLAALVAGSAASKAERWAVPVHVQAHSALPLQHLAESGHSCAGAPQANVCTSKSGSSARAPAANAPAARARPSVQLHQGGSAS